MRLGHAAHRDRSFLTVPFVVEILVGLQFFEIRQDLVPAPTGRATRFPFVIVGRGAAVGHLTIDGRTAAENARLLVFTQRRFWRVLVVMGNHLGGDT